LESTIKFEDSTQTMKDIYSKIPTFIAGLFWFEQYLVDMGSNKTFPSFELNDKLKLSLDQLA
jgi:hypothetical protein